MSGSSPDDSAAAAPATEQPARQPRSVNGGCGGCTQERARAPDPPDPAESTQRDLFHREARLRNTEPWHPDGTGPVPTANGPVRKRWRKVALRTLSKSWNDSLFGMSSQAAFWSALSTAPLLLALLGLSGYVARADRSEHHQRHPRAGQRLPAHHLQRGGRRQPDRQHRRRHPEQQSGRRDLGRPDHQPVGGFVGDDRVRRVHQHRLLPARVPSSGAGAVLRSGPVCRGARGRHPRGPAAGHRPRLPARVVPGRLAFRRSAKSSAGCTTRGWRSG